MILKSVRLNNIRSYTNAEIEFPAGSVLLAGDIGSGKSTILQAVEFALFGIKRGELSGSSLLRHGKREGYVELKFELDGKDIIIKRNLKQVKDDIKQDAGYIILDNKKKDGTAVELKTAVFDLLGYPKGLVSKSKDLVYRYTVYTPQEEMKQILFEDKDTRLDTLRRVFGIDKYKRVRENSLIAIKELKESIREGIGFIENLEDKKREKSEMERGAEKLKQQLAAIMPKLNEKKENLERKNEEIKDIEIKIKKLNELKKELAVNDADLRNHVERRKENSDRLKLLEGQIKEIGDEKPKAKHDAKEIKDSIANKNNEIMLMERTLKEIGIRLNEAEFRIRNSNDIKKKISLLDICPTCKQSVTPEHKHSVVEREEKTIKGFETDREEYNQREKEAAKMLERLKEELERLKQTERDYELGSIRIKGLEEKSRAREELEKEQERIKNRVGEINIRKIELNKNITELHDIEEGFKRIKEEQEWLREGFHKLELERVSFEKEIEGINRLLSSLNEEIAKKSMVKERVKCLREMQDWLEGFFIGLMSTIERQVMLRLYAEFNELFQNWFKVLVEDETINTRLDEDFTPVIEQNGYETGLENLSGGERTSLALAYRLSLNKVINDFIEGVKTKDIIILDEPTDGFSTEQLDRVRDVIEQLNIKQVIIVSHESKMESFVDNIIRIRKEEHVSSVI